MTCYNKLGDFMCNKSNKEISKKKSTYSRRQFIFNVVSLVFLLGVVGTLGIRSFYYFAKINYEMAQSDGKLGYLVKTSQEEITVGDGLYKVNDEYYYKGMATNNYVSYANRLFRIMKINADDSVLLISEDNQTVLPYGDSNNYMSSSPRYYFNNIEGEENSGAYLDSLGDYEYFLETMPWSLEVVVNSEVVSFEEYEDDYIRLLTVEDYLMAGGKEGYLFNGEYTYLMSVNNELDNLYINKTGDVAGSATYNMYGVRPVMTISSDVEVSRGNGSVDDPYVLDKEKDEALVLDYVLLGEDKYQIIEDNNNILKLTKVESSLVYEYSSNTSNFVTSERNSLAQYLNTTFYNSLSYKDYLVDCTFYNGELSDDTGYHINNLYSSSVVSKVGLSSITDIKVNSEVSDYFLINKTSQYGQMGFVHNNSGVMNFSLVSSKKLVVPSICINKDNLADGDGTIYVPYAVK